MISWRADNTDDQEDSGKLGFWVAKDDIVYERLTITKDGNVGIDKTSPSYKLDVNGDVNIPNASKYKINGNDLVLNDLPSSNGNYGIGTNNPTSILDIAGSEDWDGMTKLRILNPASLYGRTQIQLVGRFYNNNDFWNLSNFRNGILFSIQTSKNSAIVYKNAIQSKNGDLGILS